MQEATIKKEVTVLATQAQQLSITNDEQMREATVMLSTVNKQADIIKDFKEKVTKPLNQALRAERARWKPLEDQLASATKVIRTAMIVYQTAMTKKAEAEKEKIVARIGEGKGKIKVTTAAGKLAEVATPDKLVSTDEGAVSFVTDYEIEIEDPRKVPLEFLDISVRKADVKRAVKAGQTIPGLIIKEIQVPKNFR